MAIKTQKTLVPKTVTVGSVKLPTPADRIGLGFVVVASYPAEVLSPGQFPLPHNPEPEPNLGSRQELSAMQMLTQVQAMATAAAPAGSAGWFSFPGSSASRRPWSPTRSRSFGTWGAARRTAPAGKLAVCRGLPVGPSRASSHAALGSTVRIGSDCQSPDRRDDRWPVSDRWSRWLPGTWDRATATAAGK